MTLAICPPTLHAHEPAPRGGRCAYWHVERQRICGRTPVAVYVNDAAPVRNSYRCSTHDQAVAQAEAARQGFVRQTVDR